MADPHDPIAAAIERELRRWDGITDQQGFQSAAPEIARRVAIAVRRVTGSGGGSAARDGQASVKVA